MKHAEQFSKLFAGLRKAYGCYRPSDGSNHGKQKGQYRIVSEDIDDNKLLELWENHLGGQESLGIVPIREDNSCVWGALDIDIYPVKHTELIQKFIKQNDLPFVITRSKSGGAHCYVFMTEPVSSSLMQEKLKELGAAFGFAKAEIFPKQTKLLLDKGDRGNILNMPYFGGASSTRYAHDDEGIAITDLDAFIKYATSKKITPRQLESLVAKSVDVSSKDPDLKGAPPCLTILCSLGFPEGTRNNGLFDLGVFARKKFQDGWEKKVEEFNFKFMKPPLGAQEVLTVIKALNNKEYHYKCNDQPIASHCNSSVCRTVEHGVGSSGGLPQFGNLQKQDSMPPIWFLDVEGQRLELTTEELQNQTKFQRRCMEALNFMPPTMRQTNWRTIMQQLLDSVSIIEVSQDVSIQGQFMELLESFCTERAQAQSRDEILLGKPWTEEDKTYFRLKDLIDYFNRQQFRDYGRNHIAARLRELGGGHHFFHVKGKGITVWFVPEFNSQAEGFDLPEMTEEPF
jgi:hypothetical protein